MNNIRLSDSEWKLMTELWPCPPKTLTNLTAALKESCGWTKSTVVTLLGRMVQKGAIYYEEGERARMYYPAVSRADLASTETDSFIDKVYGGNTGMLLSALVDGERLSDAELDQLHTLLDKAQSTREAQP